MISAVLILAIAFLSLIVLMVIHELGHFLIAKKFGIKVEEFGIGYPPRLFGKKIGETIYSVNLIPLGAFVKIYGEEGGVEDSRSFTSLKIWKRALIVVGGVVAFWLAAMVIFSVVFAIGAKLPVSDQDSNGMTNPEVSVVQVEPNSPAQAAGLKVGDVILKVTSNKYESANAGPEAVDITKIKDFQDFTKAHGGEQIKITVQRNGETIEASLSPRTSAPAGGGIVGVGLQRMATLIRKYPWYLAPVQGVYYTVQITGRTFGALYSLILSLFGGKGLPAGADFAGPLGITVFLANAASYGAGFFLYFIGVISVLVAVFNLFPIPALDGGKLVFLLIEKLRGKPISVKVEQSITVSFFVILIALSLFVTVRFDIPRFTDFLKNSF